MSAAKRDITIDMGTDYRFTLKIQDSAGALVDLSSGTAADFTAEIRPQKSAALAAAFTTSFLTDGTDGEVVFFLSDDKTLSLSQKHSHKYDIFWNRAVDQKIKLVYGKIEVNPNITE